MSKSNPDCLLVNPNSSGIYQDLAKDFSAIEPPTWALLLAESLRSCGHDVLILDADAERLSPEETANRVLQAKSPIVLFVVYGQNPNSGTTGMAEVERVAALISDAAEDSLLGVVGSHASALPRQVLSVRGIDFVLLNEGVYALRNLVASDPRRDLHAIKGIGYKLRGPAGTQVIINEPERIVPQDRMDIDLPGYAWDLLPYRERPLDMYRAHFWHAGFDFQQRTPFAAIYTSLGCQFGCDFCMINIVNRVDNGEEISAADSRGMRFWSSSWVTREMAKLADLGVKTLRISDEMFFLNRRYYEPILQNVVNESFDFNMWTYSRIDTVRPSALELFRSAGVNWLALGVEAGNQMVRQEVSKGSFKEVSIKDICHNVREANINVISNYIFGFPHDTIETMQETLDLALELNTEMANMYPCQALPGSPIYHEALRKGWELPSTYAGFGFLSYEALPLPTNTLSSAEVLKFRDDAWNTYFTNPEYLNLVETRFGRSQRQNVEQMTQVKLKRQLLGD